MASFSGPAAIALNAGVINRARARRRRRVAAWGISTVAALTAASIGAAVLAGGGGGARSERVSPDVLLSQPPDMGITCGTPHCDRIGLSVWLRRPARSVCAVVDGQHIALSPRLAAAFLPGPAARATMFSGYARIPALFKHLHLWSGPGPVSWYEQSTSVWPAPLVAITISPKARSNVTYTTALNIPLAAGYG